MIDISWFGIGSGAYSDPEGVTELCVAAEQLGYESVWVGEAGRRTRRAKGVTSRAMTPMGVAHSWGELAPLPTARRPRPAAAVHTDGACNPTEKGLCRIVWLC